MTYSGNSVCLGIQHGEDVQGHVEFKLKFKFKFKFKLKLANEFVLDDILGIKVKRSGVVSVSVYK